MIQYTVRRGLRVIVRTTNYHDAYTAYKATPRARMTSREVQA